MNVFELTRALVDIESITNNEERVGLYLYDYLHPSPRSTAARSNVSRWSPAASTSSPSGASRSSSRSPPTWTPCRPSSPRARTTTYIWGRGACDTKGIIASMIKAVEALLEQGERGFGLLFVVGEERNSAGAYQAAQTGRADRATSSTASPPKTDWRSAPKARCATKSWPPGRWRTRPIRNWANRPSTSCSTRSPISAASRCRSMPCSGPAR